MWSKFLTYKVFSCKDVRSKFLTLLLAKTPSPQNPSFGYFLAGFSINRGPLASNEKKMGCIGLKGPSELKYGQRKLILFINMMTTDKIEFTDLEGLSLGRLLSK